MKNGSITKRGIRRISLFALAVKEDTVTKDEEKAKVFNAFFASSLRIVLLFPWVPSYPTWEAQQNEDLRSQEKW